MAQGVCGLVWGKSLLSLDFPLIPIPYAGIMSLLTAYGAPCTILPIMGTLWILGLLLYSDTLFSHRDAVLDGYVRHDTVWMATGSGVLRWDPVRRMPEVLDFAGSAPVFALTMAGDTLWLGTNDVLQCTGEVCGSLGLPGRPVRVRNLIRLGDTLWVATEGVGLARYVTSTGTWTLFRRSRVPVMLSDTVYRIRVQGDTLYVATAWGLHRVDRTRMLQLSAWEDTLLTGHAILDVLPLPGTLWVAALDGLYRGRTRVDTLQCGTLAAQGGTYAACVGAGLYRWTGGAWQAVWTPDVPIQAWRLMWVEGRPWVSDLGFLSALPALSPERGGGVWVEGVRIRFSPLPWNRWTDLGVDGAGRFWALVWNRQGIPSASPGAVMLMAQGASPVVVADTFPQPFVLAPDSRDGVWIGRYRWGGPADGGRSVYHLRWNPHARKVDTLQVDTLFAPLVFSLVSDGAQGYNAWLYNGGSTGRFTLLHRGADGTYRVLTEATELFRVPTRGGLVRVGEVLVTGSHLQGVLVHDTLGRLIQVLGTAQGLADVQVMDVQAQGDTVWVLTRHALQRLVPGGSGFVLQGTFHASPGESLQSMAVSRSSVFLLTSRALIQLDPSRLQVNARWTLGQTLPGQLWPTSERAAVHRSLVYEPRNDVLWINTTAGLIRFSLVTVPGAVEEAYRVFPNPLRGATLFVRGPAPERWWVVDPLGHPVPVRASNPTLYGIRLELSPPRGRGVYRLILERKGRRWVIPFTWIP